MKKNKGKKAKKTKAKRVKKFLTFKVNGKLFRVDLLDDLLIYPAKLGRSEKALDKEVKKYFRTNTLRTIGTIDA